MKTISIETAIEEIKQDILAAGPRHGCDPDIIARVYSVLCADCDEPVCIVTGDKTASAVYVEGKPAGGPTAPEVERMIVGDLDDAINALEQLRETITRRGE
jgi:hypothetical protein